MFHVEFEARHIVFSLLRFFVQFHSIGVCIGQNNNRRHRPHQQQKQQHMPQRAPPAFARTAPVPHLMSNGTDRLSESDYSSVRVV